METSGIKDNEPLRFSQEVFSYTSAEDVYNILSLSFNYKLLQNWVLPCESKWKQSCYADMYADENFAVLRFPAYVYKKTRIVQQNWRRVSIYVTTTE